MKEKDCPKRGRCLSHHCFCEKTTTEEKLGIIPQPKPLCYDIDNIINIIKADKSLDEETASLLDELLEKLREEVMNLREWGQAYKYKTINLLEKQKI